jgi:hypothetical protein
MSDNDRSLAFTALLENDAQFGKMDMNASGERITEFLADWAAARRPPMFDYSKQWVAELEAPAGPGDPEPEDREAEDLGTWSYGALDQRGQSEQIVYLPSMPGARRETEVGERQAMDRAERNAEVDRQHSEMDERADPCWLVDMEPGS